MRAGTKPGLMALPLPLPCSDKGALLLPPRTGAIGPGVCPAALAGGRGAAPAPAVVPEPSSLVLVLSRTALLWPGVPAGAAFGSRSLARVSPVPAVSAAAQEGAPGAPACPGSPRPARGHPRGVGVSWCRGGFVGGAKGADLLPHGAAVLEPAVLCSQRAGEYCHLPGFQFKIA